MRKSSNADIGMGIKGGLDQSLEVPRLITIKSRLAETIRFPSYGSTSILLQDAEQSALKHRPSDSIRRFSEMYQWLKEHLNDSTYTEIKVVASKVGS